MVGAGFQSVHIGAHVVEGLTNVLQPTDNDTEYNLFQMKNETSQFTQIFPQLVQKMQQI